MPVPPIPDDRQDGTTIRAAHVNQLAAGVNDLQQQIDDLPPGGYSAYELWTQQPGNEGKSLADFFEALRSNEPGPPGPVPAAAGPLAERPAPGTLPEGYSYFAVDDAGGITSTVVGGAWVRHTVAADWAESAVGGIATDAVNELPELADSLSTAVDSSTPGLVTVNVVHHPFGQSFVNNSTTETTLNTSTPEIPGGTLDLAAGLVDFEFSGEVNNTSGSPVTFTVRLKASQGGSTVSTWTIPFTLEANGKALYSWSGSAAVVDIAGIQKHFAGVARASASLADLTPVVNGAVAPATVNMNPSLPITWSVTGQMTVAANGTNVMLTRGSIRHLATA